MLIIQPKPDADAIDYLAKYAICMMEHREVFNAHGEFVNKKSPGFPTIEVDGTTLFGQMYSMTVYVGHKQDHEIVGAGLLVAVQKLLKLHDIKLFVGHKVDRQSPFTQVFEPWHKAQLKSFLYKSSNEVRLSFVRRIEQHRKYGGNNEFDDYKGFIISFQSIARYDFKTQPIYPNVNGVFVDSDLILSLDKNPKVQIEHADDKLSVFVTRTIENKMLKLYSLILFNEEIILHDFWNFIDFELQNIDLAKVRGHKIIKMSLPSGKVFRYPTDIKKCVEFANFIKPNCFICAGRLYGECYFMVEIYHDYEKEVNNEPKPKKAVKPKFAYRGFSTCKVCAHSSEVPRRVFIKTHFVIIYDTEVKFDDVLDNIKCSAEKLKVLRELNTIFEGGVKNLKSITDDANYIVTPSFILVPNVVESLATVSIHTTRKVIKYNML